MTVLLDTHALLWWFSGGGRLSPAATETIDGADRVLLSPVSCWEIAMLQRDGRIRLDRPISHWIASLLDDRRSAVAGLSPEAAAWAGSIDQKAFPADPADRLIYATARDLRVPLVSKDQRMHTYAARSGDVQVVW